MFVLEKFLKLLNLRAEEAKLALSLWLLLAINMMVLELSDVVATAGFVSNLGVDKVPALWIITTLITIFAAGGYVLFVDRFSRLNLVTWLLLGLAAIYLVLQVLFEVGISELITYPALYVLADQQFMIMPLAFWALANDVYSMSESQRIFPIVASGAVIGGLMGNGLAAGPAVYLAEKTGSIASILMLAASLLVLAVVLIRSVFRKRPLRARQSREADVNLRDTLKVGLDYFQNLPLFKAVGYLMIFAGIVLTLIEFNFLAIIESSVASDLEFQQFLGLYKAVQTTGILLFQWLITSRILTKISLKNAFSVLPIALTTASVVALALPNLIGGAASRFFSRTVLDAWDDPARKALQGLIPDERRGRIATFMDSYFITSATILACLLLITLLSLAGSGVIGPELATKIYLTVAGLAAAGGVASSFYLKKVYDASLLNYRLARSKRKSVLDGIEF
ncbi:MAG: hypothetical protein Kow002_11080 [Anaerolineales bacterium]